MVEGNTLLIAILLVALYLVHLLKRVFVYSFMEKNHKLKWDKGEFWKRILILTLPMLIIFGLLVSYLDGLTFWVVLIVVILLEAVLGAKIFPLSIPS
tara:strand:+ start:230 stop:520 length:291 start_codon:yes stop_codon:yes gene_type:complete